MELKKRQHYVWKHYLKPWTSNNQICCQRNGKKFTSSLENIGQRRFFYESQKLNAVEQYFIVKFLKGLGSENSGPLIKMLGFYNAISNSNNYIVKCGIEDLHSMIESKSIYLLEKLYVEDCSFFNYEEQRKDFAFFIAAQYSRTNKMRENLKKVNFQTPNVNSEKMGRVLHLFFLDIIGKWIFHKAKIQLLVNHSNIDFLTSDQPVVNALGIKGYDKLPDGFELYYPISPKYAIYLSEKLEEKTAVFEKTVLKFNGLMRRHSYEQLYAKDMSVFE